MNYVKDEFLWCEKYRPQNIDDCVLSKELSKTFNEIVKSGEIHNMLFVGSAGSGKTTLARALCRQLDIDYLFINASEESGIDVLRNKIRQYASTVSLGGNYKVVILDEADYLGGATQPALRGFIEEFSNNCRFILTCNFKNKIIEPLHSRLTTVDFATSKSMLAGLAGDFMTRMKGILKNENVKYDNQVLAELIIKFAPDWRRVINECQRFSVSGELLISSIAGASDEVFAQLIKHLKEKDFKSMRAWVASNGSLDSTTLFRKIYDSMSEVMKPESIPGAVLTLADYSYKSNMVSDKELNTAACLVTLMAEVNWK